MTFPGNAQLFGALMDAIDFPEKVGTICCKIPVRIIFAKKEKSSKCNDYFNK